MSGVSDDLLYAFLLKRYKAEETASVQGIESEAVLVSDDSDLFEQGLSTIDAAVEQDIRRTNANMEAQKTERTPDFFKEDFMDDDFIFPFDYYANY